MDSLATLTHLTIQNFASKYQKLLLSSIRVNITLAGMCSHLLGVPTVDPLPHTVWNLQLCANSGFLSLLLSLNLNLGLRTLNFIPNLPSQTLIFAPSFSVACHSDSGLYILWIHGSYSKTRDVMVKSGRLWSKATQMLVLTPLLTAG